MTAPAHPAQAAATAHEQRVAGLVRWLAAADPREPLAVVRTRALATGVDVVVVDEAHHATAASYRRVIDAAQSKNNRLQVFGVTATPNRGDGVGLRAVFSNVADHIRLGELIASGHLVRPRTFVVDLGVQGELSQVRRSASDFDKIATAKVSALPPPPIQGIGNAGGFRMMIEDRSGAGPQAVRPASSPRRSRVS